jgi:UDP:flavonoid glycosyltransferase YjiC (YdhE family)
MPTARHIAITAAGSLGDVNPLLGVGVGLQRLGHRVTAVLNPAYETRARSLGLGFAPAGEPWSGDAIADRPDFLHPARGSVRMLTDLIIPSAGPTFNAIVDLARRDPVDALVGHHVSFATPWAAERLGVPWAMAAVAPASWPSVDDPNLYPGMPDRDRYPRWTVRLGGALGTRAVSRAVDPVVNRVRAELGLPAIRRAMFDAMFSADAHLGLWSPAYRPPASDDPPRSRIVGFPFVASRADANDQLDQRLAAFFDADAGDPPVVFTLGSTAVHALPNFAEMAAGACAALGVRGLVLAGSRATHALERFGDPSAPVFAVAFAPHEAVLPRARAAVHHGGIGTAAQTLRAGKPAVIVPFTHDQPDNARRCRLLGVSETVKPKRLSERTLTTALRRVLDEATFARAAHAMADRLSTEDGSGAAAATVHDVLPA